MRGLKRRFKKDLGPFYGGWLKMEKENISEYLNSLMEPDTHCEVPTSKESGSLRFPSDEELNQAREESEAME
jgi:hypothetical protein